MAVIVTLYLGCPKYKHAQCIWAVRQITWFLSSLEWSSWHPVTSRCVSKTKIALPKVFYGLPHAFRGTSLYLRDMSSEGRKKKSLLFIGLKYIKRPDEKSTDHISFQVRIYRCLVWCGNSPLKICTICTTFRRTNATLPSTAYRHSVWLKRKQSLCWVH